MNNKFLAYLILVCLGACTHASDLEKIPKNARVNLSGEQERAMTMDPVSKQVPKDRLFNGIKQMKQQIALSKDGLLDGIASIEWKERGPDNVAGRTRAILLDKNDESRNTLIAGGVSGGLWRTTNLLDEVPNWKPINDFWANLMVTCIAQDPTDPSRIYVGTGEGWFREDERMKGFGIWFSVDGGLSFEQLPLTRTPIFSHIQDIVVDGYGVIYASTRMNGVMRSSDQGQSWTQVLGSSIGAGSTNRAADLEIGPDQTIYASLGIHSTGSLWKSNHTTHAADRGKNGTWTEITPPQGEYSRIEIAVAPSDANRIYFLAQGSTSNDCKYMFRSENAGQSWTSMPIPKTTDRKVFTRGQAWHNLIAAVDPNNEDRVFIGGVNLYVSGNGGRTFRQFTHDYGTAYQYVHADQHAIQFAEGSSDFMLFANDGGVWLSTDGSANIPTVIDRNKGYNVTQFYSGAIHPFDNDYMLGGTQDNGTRQFFDAENWATNAVNNGDGGFAHIDEDFGFIQISAYLYNYYWVTSDGWQNRRKITVGRNDGRFINPTDYDSELNILYAAHRNGLFARIADVGSSNKTKVFPLPEFGGDMVSAVFCSPNVKGRVYFGLGNGNVVRVDNADSESPVGTLIYEGLGYVSCIAVEEGNEDHILISYSNYGVLSIWETMNSGQMWKPIDGNLPDMPVRWIMFAPGSGSSALIATELGVWRTNQLESVYTSWEPVNQGMANVRTDMLQYDKRTHRIMAATHGRGVFVTDAYVEVDTTELICGWDTFPGTLKEISIAGEDGIWGISPTGDLLTYDEGEWRRILRDIQDVGIGAAGNLFALGDGLIYESLTGVTWTGFSGAGKRVDVASDGTPFIVSQTNYIYTRIDGVWDRLPGRAIDVGCGADGSVYMVGNDQTVNKWSGVSWNEMPNISALRIDVDEEGFPWIINPQNEVLRFNGIDWDIMWSEEAQDITCDGLGNTYVTSLSGVINKWGCTAIEEIIATDSTLVEDTPYLGAEDLAVNVKTQAFPNPFTDQLNLSLGAFEEGTIQLQIFDSNGQIKYNYEGSAYYEDVVSSSNWPAGIYWMKVQHGKYTRTTRLIKIQP